jgi:hypothetical protein
MLTGSRKDTVTKAFGADSRRIEKRTCTKHPAPDNRSQGPRGPS